MLSSHATLVDAIEAAAVERPERGIRFLDPKGRPGELRTFPDLLVSWKETGKKLAEKRVPSRNGLRFAAISPDGRKAYLTGRGHELVVFDESFEHLKTIEMPGELRHSVYVIEE